MSFEGNEYMIGSVSDANRFPSEEEYPFLVRDLLEYIEKVKSEEVASPGQGSSIIEIIMDYAFKNNIDVESVGDAVASDDHFKSFIESDCLFRGVFGETSLVEDW